MSNFNLLLMDFEIFVSQTRKAKKYIDVHVWEFDGFARTCESLVGTCGGRTMHERRVAQYKGNCCVQTMTFAQDDNNLTTLLSELINNPPRAKISNTRFEDSILISLSFRRNQLCYFYFLV